MQDNDDRRSLVMAEMMTPDKANFSGHVHGGHLMQLLDRVAYACAARYAGTYVVTLSANHILFKQPIFVGEMVNFYANVNHVGSSSMEVGIKVVAENLTSGERRHTNTCYFTMVSVDDQGKPRTLPPLELRDDLERYRSEEAKLRKKHRLLLQEQQAEHKKRIRTGGDTD
jgi:acyl-CoA hydrolase